MVDVFISHSREDRELAAVIRDRLGEVGLDAFDTREIPSSSEIAATIQEAIEGAHVFILLWSGSATGSEWIRYELNNALRAWSTDRLVIAAIDDAALPVGLRDLESITIDRQGGGVDQLIERAFSLARGEDDALLRRSSAPVPYLRDKQFLRWAGLLSLLVGLGVLAGVAVIALVPFLREWSLISSSELSSPLLWIIALLIGIATWVWSRSASRAPGSSTLSVNIQPVFVSYSRKDAHVVTQIVGNVRQLGIPIAIDTDQRGAKRFAGPIVRAIKQARVVAVMSSANAFASDHVIREIYVAGEHRKPFVAVLLDGTEFPDEVVYFMSGFPRLPMPIDYEELREHLEASLQV